MGLFVSNDNLNGYSYNSGYHTDLYSPSDYTIYDEGVDINYTTLGYEIVAESQQEWNTLMKQVALNELAVYSSNGCREVLYEAVDFSALFTRIKNFFKKLADKVKAIFHSFMAKLSSILSRDSSFAKKYGNEFIRKVQNIKDDFEFKGYTFTIKKFSNRDDITFDSQLANIYINKAKVGETKIDNSIVNLLNSRGSVSDSLLNPSTFVESVGYYGDYYVLNEYKFNKVTDYDKIYIIHTYGNDTVFGKNNMDFINDLYNQNKQLTDNEINKVKAIFDKIYEKVNCNRKVKVTDNLTYEYVLELLNFLHDVIEKKFENDINELIKRFNGKKSIISSTNIQILNTLMSKLKNANIDASLLGQYDPTPQTSGSSSGSGNSGSSSSSGATQQPQNSDYYTQKEYFQKYDEIRSKLKDQSLENIKKWSDDADKIEERYKKMFNNNYGGKINKIVADMEFSELQNLVNRYNKAYQAAQASGSGPSSSGSGTAQQNQTNNSNSSTDYYSFGQYASLYQNIYKQVHFSSANNEDSFDKKVDEIEQKYKLNTHDRSGKIAKSEADKCLKEIENLKNNYNKAYQAAQASGSGPSSSGSGTAQQSQNNGNTMKKDDFNKKFKEIKDSMTNSNYRTEFFNKVANILDDNDAEISKPDIEKSIADKILKEIEDLVDEYNKKPKNTSGGNSGGNSGGSGSVGDSSGSGSVGGRNIDYNSPAEKADVYKRANISIQDNSEDIHDTIRGAVAKLYTDNSSAADSYSERDFKNELFKLFRNGADKKDSIPASEIKKNASAIVDEVTTYKNTKDMAKESTNTVVKAIDSVINKLDEYIKRSNKNWTEGSDGTLTTNFTNLLTTITNVFFKTSRSDIVLANNIYLTALKDRCIQNKNIMVKVIAGYDSKKMKNTNESYDYDNDYIYNNNNSNSFLDKGYWYYLQVK